MYTKLYGVPQGTIIIIMLLFNRSGKSSIAKVVFHKMSPNETLFLESTNKIVKDGMFTCVHVVCVIACNQDLFKCFIKFKF